MRINWGAPMNLWIRNCFTSIFGTLGEYIDLRNPKEQLWWKYACAETSIIHAGRNSPGAKWYLAKAISINFLLRIVLLGLAVVTILLVVSFLIVSF